MLYPQATTDLSTSFFLKQRPGSGESRAEPDRNSVLSRIDQIDPGFPVTGLKNKQRWYHGSAVLGLPFFVERNLYESS